MLNYYLEFCDVRFAYQLEPILNGFTWQWHSHQQIAIVGGNGSGKSTLAKLITDQLRCNHGEIHYAGHLTSNNIVHVSFDLQRELIEHDQRFDDSETRDDAFDKGTSVRDIILQGREPTSEYTALCVRLGIQHILDQGIRFISTGESRKTLLARALLSEPAALILDNPLEGLDQHSQADMSALLCELVDGETPLLLLLKDPIDIPHNIDRVMQLDGGKITGESSVLEAQHRERPQHHFNKPLPIENAPPYPADQPLITIHNASVNFHGKQVLSNINWQLLPNQHCCISGPNGAGKSTLLGLLYGDNDKAYGQDVELFGRRRGSGESVWEIKAQFGVLNTSMQLNHLKRSVVFDVVASGLFDSIGLYRDCSDAQRRNVSDWLDAFDLLALQNHRFDRLSFGEQRMVLLIRAMVKSPRILVLDEPCIGLDPEQKSQLLAAIDYIAERQQTRILFVS
ncbi:MAG: ATP-binding cassette domain-containing protein, partial [Spongiibacteraceae bacterium]